MPEYLSTDALKNASELVNTTLLSKGYITESLKFPAIDWDELISDQPEKEALQKFQVTEKSFNNDKNVVNIIYSLTQSIDRHHAQHKSFNKALSQKDSTIEELRRKIEHLELQAQTYEFKINKLVQVDQTTLTDKVKHLTKINKVQSQELAKVKIWTSEIQTKYDVEMRKKNIEISLLRDKLLDTRNLSSTITYGRPMEFAPSPTATGLLAEVNSNILYNNKPTINSNHARDVATVDSSMSPIWNQEYEGIANQLSELIENLIKENSKFANFMKELNSYFSKFNAQLSVLHCKNLTVSSLANPSDEIDMDRIISTTSTEIDPFDFVSKPLFSNVYKNYHYVSGLIDVVVANLGNLETTTENEDGKKELEKLKEENQLLYDKWHEAIEALDNWKKYSQK